MLERGIYKPKTMNWKSARRHNQRRLQSLSGEEMQGNQSNKARSGIWFWSRGQRAFSNIRVFDPNAQCYQRKNLQKCYEMNEQEKKRQYNLRILKVELRTFTPPVFSKIKGIRRKC